MSSIMYREPRSVVVVNSEYEQEVSPACVRGLTSAARSGSAHGAAFAGRGAAWPAELASGRCVVVRCARRGGWVRRILHDAFLRLPGTSLDALRPLREFEMLSELCGQGAAVPCPVAAGVELIWNGAAYRGFVITEFVPEAVNLLSLIGPLCGGTQEVADIEQACTAAGAQARLALNAGIAHADLHLGNVLRQPSGRVYLIDFDKARRVNKEQREKASRAIAGRWARSVRKHLSGKPELAVRLERAFSGGLEQ